MEIGDLDDSLCAYARFEGLPAVYHVYGQGGKSGRKVVRQKAAYKYCSSIPPASAIRPLWCASLRHNQKCIAEIRRPIFTLFLIPLVEVILLIVQTKLSDRSKLAEL